MQCPPDADASWLLAAVQAVVAALAPPGPVDIAPSLLARWRAGRILAEYREQWWRRELNREPPSPGATGFAWFPYDARVLIDLADQLQVPGYNRQALSACLAYAHRHPTSATLPRGTAWTVIKMGCAKERRGKQPKKRRAGRTVAEARRAALYDLLWGVLPEALPGCRVYQDRAAASTPGCSMAFVQTMAGDVFAAVISIAGSKQPRHCGSQVPSVELHVGAGLRRGQLVGLRRVPASWRPQLDGTTWLRLAQRRARSDPYDGAPRR